MHRSRRPSTWRTAETTRRRQGNHRRGRWCSSSALTLWLAAATGGARTSRHASSELVGRVVAARRARSWSSPTKSAPVSCRRRESGRRVPRCARCAQRAARARLRRGVDRDRGPPADGWHDPAHFGPRGRRCAHRRAGRVAREAALRRQARLTKPTGALGRLESSRCGPAACRAVPAATVARVRRGAHRGRPRHRASRRSRPTRPKSPPQMVANFLAGGAAVNVLAREVGAIGACCRHGRARRRGWCGHALQGLRTGRGRSTPRMRLDGERAGRLFGPALPSSMTRWTAAPT